MPQTSDSTTILLALILVGIFAALLLGLLLTRLSRFKHDLDIYNMEITRTTGAERRYWREKRRRLWLWLFFLSSE